MSDRMLDEMLDQESNKGSDIVKLSSPKIQFTPELVSQLADESSTSIYVADCETDELLYINETGEAG